MEKRIGIMLIALTFLVLSIKTQAQVIVNYTQPEFNKWHTEDMWNLMITNLSDKPVTIVLNGTLEESNKGMIVEGSTSELTLGAKYSGSIAFEDLLPVDVKFLGDKNYQEVYEKTGSLPVGSYTICVYVKDSKSGVELAKDCYSFQISPAAPPFLLSPVDKTQLSEKLPVFTWLPPMPPVGNNTNYLLEIVEMYANQTHVEAMKSNSRWLSEKDINTTTFQYQIAAREFEIGKSYAWQITAFEGRNEIGKSEVWSFSYNTEFSFQIDSVKIFMLNPVVVTGGDIFYKSDTSNIGSGIGVVVTGGDIFYRTPADSPKCDGADNDCDVSVVVTGGDIFEGDEIYGKVLSPSEVLYLIDKKGRKIYDFIVLQKGDIVKRTKVNEDYEYSIETDRRYMYEIYVTNTNPEDAIFSISGITKTKPKSKSPVIIKGDRSVEIKSGERGVLKGIITSGKTTLNEITLEIKLESNQLVNKKSKNEQRTLKPLALPHPSSYDYGDAVSPYPIARHIRPPYTEFPKNHIAWLGNAPTSYHNSGFPICPNSCNTTGLIDFETQNDVNDEFDNGIHFFTPESMYCNECDIDSIDVTITINSAYKRQDPLYLHGWIDFNRDGDWNDNSTCGSGLPTKTEYEVSEKLHFTKAKLICPLINLDQTVNLTKFKINPNDWPSNLNCATYRLFYKTGKTPDNASNDLWARFRLTSNNNLVNSSGDIIWGEVEDYKISCSTAPPLFDFGDAPDEIDNSSMHYCTHLLNCPPNCAPNQNRPPVAPWTIKDAASHIDFTHEWLGPIENSDCPEICSGISAESECNGETIDLDIKDDGVRFNNFHFPFNQCDTQYVDVMVNTASLSRYIGKKLRLHAWFDWNVDGDWDDYFTCDSTPANEHIYWLSGQALCPGSDEFEINDSTFWINPYDPMMWPEQENKCMVFRLKFLSGKPAENELNGKNKLWCRFRLTIEDGNVVNYYNSLPYGEVEDYAIPYVETDQGCNRFYDPRDNGDGDGIGQWYNAVQIGTQCWMAENLNVGKVVSGNQDLNDNSIIEKYCYDNDVSNCLTYGGLYQWAEAMNYQNGVSNTELTGQANLPLITKGICPDGWHLPTDEEWKILEEFLEPNIAIWDHPCGTITVDGIPDINDPKWNRGENIGLMLKETGTVHWLNDFNCTNSSGFTALGGGARLNTGSFVELKAHGHWWTTTEFDANSILFRHLFGASYIGSHCVFGNEIGRGGGGREKDKGASIRCIQD